MDNSDVAIAIVVVGIVVMMIIPLPPFLLDILLTANISAALAIVLATLYTTEPLQFSVFPSLLLVATLFRLALNISGTRLILLARRRRRGHLRVRRASSSAATWSSASSSS